RGGGFKRLRRFSRGAPQRGGGMPRRGMRNADVGWVERSDTHRHARMGFAKAQPILRRARPETSRNTSPSPTIAGFSQERLLKA
ncbi:hypothetical protein C1T30_43115, partial [Bacillus sp. MBGLi97]